MIRVTIIRTYMKVTLTYFLVADIDTTSKSDFERKSICDVGATMGSLFDVAAFQFAPPNGKMIKYDL